jgi:hypothetical protein
MENKEPIKDVYKLRNELEKLLGRTSRSIKDEDITTMVSDILKGFVSRREGHYEQ